MGYYAVIWDRCLQYINRAEGKLVVNCVFHYALSQLPDSYKVGIVAKSWRNGYIVKRATLIQPFVSRLSSFNTENLHCILMKFFSIFSIIVVAL